MSDNWIIPDWPAPPNVRAAVTTRRLPGNSRPPFDAFNLGMRCGDDPGSVAANRAALQRVLGLPAAPHWLRQVHGTAVARFAAADEPAREPQADAAIACAAGVVLAVLTADCLPILISADDGSEIAVAHAGWRGLASGVIEATLDGLATPPARLLVWLGPAIAARSYEVGAEVRAAFAQPVAADPQAMDDDARTTDSRSEAASPFAATRPGHWHCDLAGIARQRLSAHGVTRVHGGDFDTASDGRFYSYRRDDRCGRFASLIWRTR
ncbi:MAG TPA: peptidoglycan editing factor PgeF [Rhodanobacteraceae bacterium]|nr:peptidoglycan editing factor PgeF [Rhodanobacteraceae bacterium]